MPLTHLQGGDSELILGKRVLHCSEPEYSQDRLTALSRYMKMKVLVKSRKFRDVGDPTGLQLLSDGAESTPPPPQGPRAMVAGAGDVAGDINTLSRRGWRWRRSQNRQYSIVAKQTPTEAVSNITTNHSFSYYPAEVRIKRLSCRIWRVEQKINLTFTELFWHIEVTLNGSHLVIKKELEWAMNIYMYICILHTICKYYPSIL